MKCAWQTFINLLPVWMRNDVDKHGKDTLQELRLRLNKPPELVRQHDCIWLDRCVTYDDLLFCVNVASRYSPWAATTSSRGYITAQGGHRIGLCGSAIILDGEISGVHNLTSLCLRVARDFFGIAQPAAGHSGSIMIVGPPGSGKTTLLRDLIRIRSEHNRGCIAVVDEREEIFPKAHNNFCFDVGRQTDILSGCCKARGIEMVIRSMGPHTIAIDEITAQEDAQALLYAGWCGVNLIATAHAGNKEDFYPVRFIVQS